MLPEAVASGAETRNLGFETPHRTTVRPYDLAP
jgi:hypothetical protein